MLISIMLILSILIAMCAAGFIAAKIGGSLGSGNIVICLPIFLLVQWLFASVLGTHSIFTVVKNAMGVFGL